MSGRVIAVELAQNFVQSAKSFAGTALDASVERDPLRTALDAGTALEHLTKAVLATRSPVLISELRGESSFDSLLVLLDMPEGRAGSLRTVSLRDALKRAKRFVDSVASDADLAALVDIRDGVVHAALAATLGDKIIIAFLEQTTALLADLGIHEDDYWGSRKDLVLTLRRQGTNRTQKWVDLKLIAARIAVERRYGVVREDTVPVAALQPDEEPQRCPACGAVGAVRAAYELDGDPAVNDVEVTVMCKSFRCESCALMLDGPKELLAARLPTSWVLDSLTVEDLARVAAVAQVAEGL